MNFCVILVIFEFYLFATFHYLDSTTTSKTTAVKEDPSDVLDKAMCLTALAELRHAKWFQVGNGVCSNISLCYNML